MSTLEWRREQPRVEPPRPWTRNPALVALLLFDSAVWAGAFVANGEAMSLVWAMAFGVMAWSTP